MPFELGHDPAMSRDDLVVTLFNAQVVRYIEQWPDWPSPATILIGPPGSGKSHLAAIWKVSADATQLSADSIGIENGADAGGNFLIEDVDRTKIDATGLFHLFNITRANGGSLLLTARASPANWSVELPDLASRLRSAGLVTISEPDDTLLSGVITKLFADRQIVIEPHIVAYLVSRMERSLVVANMLVEQIDKLALERKTRITRALAAEALEVLDQPQD